MAWNDIVAEKFGELAEVCCRAGKKDFEIWLGLNTREGYFGISWSEKPLSQGESDSVIYHKMPLNSTEITMLTLRLKKVIGD